MPTSNKREKRHCPKISIALETSFHVSGGCKEAGLINGRWQGDGALKDALGLSVNLVAYITVLCWMSIASKPFQEDRELESGGSRV